MADSIYTPTGMRDIVEAKSRPFHAYSGENGYIFISYAHRNAGEVYPVIEDLYRSGYNVWYDEGIPNFSDLEAEIKKHIENCSLFVMFASKKSLASPYVHIEILHAHAHGKPIVCVELEEIQSQARAGRLNEQLKDCRFTRPDRLRRLIPDGCRDAQLREPDSFEPEQTGGVIGQTAPMEEYQYQIEDGGITLCKYTGEKTDVKVPSGHDGYLVTKLRETFENCRSLRSAAVPEPVTEIGRRTFCLCSAMKTIRLPKTLKIIGMGAFTACWELDLTEIPESVEEIGFGAFEGCRSITEIRIPEGVKTVRTKTFYSCEKLAEAVISRSIEKIEEMAFADCTGLRRVIIPETVSEIGYDAFSGCRGTEVVCVRGSVAHGYAKKYELGDLTAKTVTREEMDTLLQKFYRGTVEKAGGGAGGQTDPAAVQLPELEEDRDSYAYIAYADEDAGRVLPFMTELWQKGYNLCRAKGNRAAEMIAGCKTFILCITKTSFGSDRLGVECDEAFRCGADIYPVALDDGVVLPERFADRFSGKFVLHRSDRTEEDFKNEIMNHLTRRGCRATARTADERAEQMRHRDFEYEVQNGAAAITGYRGAGGDVVIPAELYGHPVNSIADSAFSGCKTARLVFIPDGVVKIGYRAFQNCDNLQSVCIPDSMAEIDRLAFDGCVSLGAAVLPGGLLTIREGTFKNCASLKTLSVPDGVTRIDDAAFMGCRALERLVFPAGLTQIGVEICRDCASLKEAVIPDGVTQIASLAFAGCRSLRTITIPAGVWDIGGGAFEGCPKFVRISGNKRAYRQYLKDDRRLQKQIREQLRH